MKYISIENELIIPGNIGYMNKTLHEMMEQKGKKIAVLGASVSQGENVPKGKDYFTYLKENWMEHFHTSICPEFINASKPGTLSANGMFSMWNLIKQKPDVVFIDYSVNDPGAYYLQEAFESMVYNFLKNGIFVIVLFFCNEKGHSTKGAMTRISRHYNIPCLDIGKCVQQNIAEGEFTWDEFASDYVHPRIWGHELIAKNIYKYLDYVLQSDASVENYEIPEEKCFDGIFCDMKIIDNLQYTNQTYCLEDTFSAFVIEFFQCPEQSNCSLDVYFDDEYILTIDKYSDFSWYNRVSKMVFQDEKNSRHKIELKPAKNSKFTEDELKELNVKFGFGFINE